MICETDPVIYPHWVADRATVYLEKTEAGDDLSFGVCLTRAAMMDCRRSYTLWFCDVPPKALCQGSNAELAWFS